MTGAKPVTGLFDGDLGSDVAGYVSETLWQATFDLGAIYFVESFRLFGDRDNDKRVHFFIYIVCGIEIKCCLIKFH